jgi:hypothetical protein
MKAIGITSTAILSLILGIAAPAYARQGQQGEKQDHPEKPQSAQHEPGKSHYKQVRIDPGQHCSRIRHAGEACGDVNRVCRKQGHDS